MCHVGEDAATQPGSAACRKPFSPKESAAFFREIAKQKAAAPKGRLQWNTIRGTLVKQLTDQKVTSFKASVSGKSLPLNVWFQKGYRQEVVEGCPNYRCPDIKVQVYQVPVKEVKWSEEHSKIEAQILQHEQEAAKKKPQANAKAKTQRRPMESWTYLRHRKKRTRQRNPTSNEEEKGASRPHSVVQLRSQVTGTVQKAITCLNKTVDKVNQASCKVEAELQNTLSDITTSWKTGQPLPAAQSTLTSPRVRCGSRKMLTCPVWKSCLSI